MYGVHVTYMVPVTLVFYVAQKYGVHVTYVVPVTLGWLMLNDVLQCKILCE